MWLSVYGRAEEAETRLAKAEEEQRAVVKRERRREREAQLGRLKAFEDKLRAALEQFRVSSCRMR